MMFVVSGCSSFNRDWKAATASPVGPASGWDGEWRSEANGHHGRLRAVVTPLHSERYRVRFRASYAGILRFGYTAELAVQPGADGLHTFNGNADLGVWGSYRCDGTISSNRMEAHYETTLDRGHFRLERVGSASGLSASP